VLRLDDRRVRIYQDGLPVCGFEENTGWKSEEKSGDTNRLWLDGKDASRPILPQSVHVSGISLPEYLCFDRMIAKVLEDLCRRIGMRVIHIGEDKPASAAISRIVGDFMTQHKQSQFVRKASLCSISP
jgi:hypothetical protein